MEDPTIAQKKINSEEVEKILRKVATTEKVLRSSRRVNVLKAIDCITALSKFGFEKEEVKIELKKLLDSYKIVKVEQSKNNPNIIDLNRGNSINISDLYIWSEEPTNHWNIIMGVFIVIVILAFVMFQMWPNWLKRFASYSKYPIGAFILFMIIAGIIRLIVFSITYFTNPPGLWLLPNLFADCGFFESFIPLYSWDEKSNNDDSHNKKK